MILFIITAVFFWLGHREGPGQDRSILYGFGGFCLACAIIAVLR